MKQPAKLTYLAPAFLCMLLGGLLWSAQPDWWTGYSLIDGAAEAQDDAVATIGQAKHAVQKAYQYLEAELAVVGGAGTEVTALYNDYCTSTPADPGNDLQALTIGQLKYLAKPFYDRLNNAPVLHDTSTMNPASTDIYPWTVDQADDEDLSLASLGQLKFVFSFDLSGWEFEDTDQDGMEDSWEIAHFGSLEVQANGDPDADGISNLDEFLYGLDPSNLDTDGDGLEDGWEVSHGYSASTNEGLAGAFGDSEGDRLANRTENEIGSSSSTVDTAATLSDTSTQPGGDLAITLIGRGAFTVDETETTSLLSN